MNNYVETDDIEDFITEEDLPDLTFINTKLTDLELNLNTLQSKPETDLTFINSKLTDLESNLNTLQSKPETDLTFINSKLTDLELNQQNYVTTEGLTTTLEEEGFIKELDLNNYVETDDIENFITEENLPDLTNYVLVETFNNRLQPIEDTLETFDTFKTQLTTLCDDNRDLVLTEFLDKKGQLERLLRQKKQTVVITLNATGNIINRNVPVLLENQFPFYQFKLSGTVKRIAITKDYRHFFRLKVGTGELDENNHLLNTNLIFEKSLIVGKRSNNQVHFNVDENTKMQLLWDIVTDHGQTEIEIPDNRNIHIEIYIETSLL